MVDEDWVALSKDLLEEERNSERSLPAVGLEGEERFLDVVGGLGADEDGR